MNRLTNHTLANLKNKDDWNKAYKKYLEQEHHLTLGELYKKLSDYEDIEEELGIDLITLFKALKQNIFVKLWEPNTNTPEIYSTHIVLNYPLLMITDKLYVSIKDYGKTWALTKEELEK